MKTGSATDNESRAQGGHKGPDSEHFKQNISSQQSEVCIILAPLYYSFCAGFADAVVARLAGQVQRDPIQQPKGQIGSFAANPSFVAWTERVGHDTKMK
jgi:hypothetical protein